MKYHTMKMLIMLGVISSTNFSNVFAQAVEETDSFSNEIIDQLDISELRKQLESDETLLSKLNEDDRELIKFGLDNFSTLSEDDQEVVLDAFRLDGKPRQDPEPTDPTFIC